MSLKAEQHILSFEVVHCDVQLINVDVLHLQMTDLDHSSSIQRIVFGGLSIILSQSGLLEHLAQGQTSHFQGTQSS